MDKVSCSCAVLRSSSANAGGKATQLISAKSFAARSQGFTDPPIEAIPEFPRRFILDQSDRNVFATLMIGYVEIIPGFANFTAKYRVCTTRLSDF
jgi:hypothetical protein